jgi:hypothetical protein
VDAHCDHVDTAKAHIESGKYLAALLELDAALQICDSPHARWNRAVSLLALGRYAEGWEDYRSRWELFGNRIITPSAARLRQVLPAWDGAPLEGKRLVLIHESGFGDTIMLLRFVPQLKGNVALVMPPELERLAAQFAPMLDEEGERDVHCFMFDLARLLDVKVHTVPAAAYITPNPWLQQKWSDRLGRRNRWKIGVAWSTMRAAPQRCIDPAALRDWLNREYPGHEAISLQSHDRDAARANGIETFEFQDFADVAACASLMDSVVSIDTAALNVAAAIGHPDVTALLPDMRCWRWHCASPWYPNVRLQNLSAVTATLAA